MNIKYDLNITHHPSQVHFIPSFFDVSLINDDVVDGSFNVRFPFHPSYLLNLL